MPMKLADSDVKIIEDLPTEVLASSIVAISASMKKLETSGLNRRALVCLLKGSTGVPMIHIDRVLNGLADLARMYTVQKK